MINAVIIDDEDHARETLSTMLEKNFDTIKIVGEANSIDTAVELIKKQQPNLVFLDIDLSDGSAFNVLEQVEKYNFHVIFVTAFNRYAIQAFRYNATDYILKPINLKILEDAISRIKLNDDYITEDRLKELIQTFYSNESDKKIVIKNKNSRSYIRVGDILYCAGEGSYTTIFLIDGGKIVASNPLKFFSLLLPEKLFCRVHQSSLVNLNYIKEYSNVDGGIIKMKNGTQIIIARRRKEELLDKMNELSCS